MWSATTFFVSQMKKENSVWNNHYKILPCKEMGKKHKATMHTNKRLSDYIYSIATL